MVMSGQVVRVVRVVMGRGGWGSDHGAGLLNGTGGGGYVLLSNNLVNDDTIRKGWHM